MGIAFMQSPSLENSRLRSLCLLGLNAAGDGIENGIPSLLDRRDGVVDSDARFPLQFFGVILCALDAQVMLCLSNARLQAVQVGGDFRLNGTPVSSSSVISGLFFLIPLSARC